MISLANLSFYFGVRQALKDVSLEVKKGEFVFLTGPSGAGKSTLLGILHGALPVMRGQAEVAGTDLGRLKKKNLPRLRRKIGIVFQNFKILPKRSVFENVALALEIRNMPKAEIRRRVEAVLSALKLSELAIFPCNELSGGEQQRVAVARAVVISPQLLLADEPTGNLDADLAARLMTVFKQFHSHGTTVVVATHNRELIKSVPEARVVNLLSGRIVNHHEDIF